MIPMGIVPMEEKIILVAKKVKEEDITEKIIHVPRYNGYRPIGISDTYEFKELREIEGDSKWKEAVYVLKKKK